VADNDGFLKYRAEHLRKINAIRRAVSQPTQADIVPVLSKGQVLFTPAAELRDEPASCYNCNFFNYGKSCQLIGKLVTIHKFIYPRVDTADSKRIEYWPHCAAHCYGQPNYGPEKFISKSDPSNLALIWINAPSVGLERSGANCSGCCDGDDCDNYMTKGPDKRAEPTAFCRVLQGEVAGGDHCTAWEDDDKVDWQKAQTLMKELAGDD
jgi:hypothetical protein